MVPGEHLALGNWLEVREEGNSDTVLQNCNSYFVKKKKTLNRSLKFFNVKLYL